MNRAVAKEVPLSVAAHRLGLSWAATWKLVLTGELIARRADARWLVEETSVATYKGRSRQQRSVQKGESVA